MKRFSKIMAIICVLAIFLCVGACNGLVAEGKTVHFKVVFDGTEKSFVVTDEIATVEDAMKALSSLDGGFSYGEENGAYGAFIVSVCGRTADSNAAEWWGVYTDTLTVDGNGVPNAYEEYTYEHGGKTYYSAAAGISSQAVSDGETILLVLSVGY